MPISSSIRATMHRSSAILVPHSSSDWTIRLLSVHSSSLLSCVMKPLLSFIARQLLGRPYHVNDVLFALKAAAFRWKTPLLSHFEAVVILGEVFIASVRKDIDATEDGAFVTSEIIKLRNRLSLCHRRHWKAFWFAEVVLTPYSMSLLSQSDTYYKSLLPESDTNNTI